MRQLQQKGPPCAKEEGSLAINLPEDSPWSKHALILARSCRTHLLKLPLQVGGSYISDHRGLR
jgi:hypothetical protein